jgi:phosphoglycolate phosphatase
MNRAVDVTLASIPPTLVLWDVDHTLIENGGVSKDTYALAYKMLVGSAPDTRPLTHGRTDFQIMGELLTANSVDVSSYAEVADFFDVLTKAMEVMAPQLSERGYALPGAREALTTIATNKAVIQSALTGNIEINARTKLGAFDLDRLIDMAVGGYGSDDPVRSNLVGIARKKVRHKYGVQFDELSTVLVGDTPLDIEAAIDGGAKIIAVASGEHSAHELRAAGATIVLDDLSNTTKVLEAISAVRK